MQCKSSTYRTVSYSVDLHEKMQLAAENKSPVKVTNVRTKKNLFNPDNMDIILSGKTTVEQTEVDFIHKESDSSEEAPVKNVKEILSSCKKNQFVSVTGYIDIDNRPSLPVKTKSGPTVKKDVTINDSTGVMKFTIWGSMVHDIPCSGVYKVMNASVNEYPKDILSLQSCFKTKFFVNQTRKYSQPKSISLNFVLMKYNYRRKL